jgi:hypothetical protein
LIRIGFTILPELANWENSEKCSLGGGNFKNLLNGRISQSQSFTKPALSLELLLLLCLPLIGFSGCPLTYNTKIDVERAFHREVAMRILN